MNFSKIIKLVVGEGNTKYKGWFSSDSVTLDITKEEDFEKFFKMKKISKILAEYVIENLEYAKLEKIVDNFYKYSNDDVNIRFALPDGFSF